MKYIKLSIELPKDILTLIRKSEEEMPAEIKKIFALELYRKKSLSFGKAAKLAGLSYADFLKLLGENKISIFDFTKEELKEELKKIKQI